MHIFTRRTEAAGLDFGIILLVSGARDGPAFPEPPLARGKIQQNTSQSRRLRAAGLSDWD